jgi:hypothetical protein
MPSQIILVDQIEPLILTIRGHKVILDSDLAALYGVATKVLNQAVKRNRSRFPADFMFQLTAKEKTKVVTNCDHLSRLKFSPTRPYAFTEHGAIMAATILNSPRAVEVSVFVVRAFVKLRELVATHKELARKLTELEQRVAVHDEAIGQLIEAIRQLMAPPPEPERRRKIGFGRQAE